MDHEAATAMIARTVQMSIAPVFLLTGIAAMLTVMTNRLSRIVDRARSLEGQASAAATDATAAVRARLATLSRRAKLISAAITLCTGTALLVCALIATLFFGVFLDSNVSLAVALLFTGAVCLFFAGLVCFLREIFIATANLRIGVA